MSDLDTAGKKLLLFLVEYLPGVTPGNPATYVSYKEIHDALGLLQQGPTFGESLKKQGLVSLAEWTATSEKPAITGLIIDKSTFMPGEGYFRLFGKTKDDFKWWQREIARAKEYDWSPYISEGEPPLPPVASDIETPQRVEVTTYRVLRDTFLARRIKVLHNFECQVCGHTIILRDGSRYAEAHHIRPLGGPHGGPDVAENVICLCPNHHAECDLGVRRLDAEEIRIVSGHKIGLEFIEYHNDNIYETAP